MRFAVITDELSRDIDTACEQITSWGVWHVTLRQVGASRIGHDLSPGFLDDLMRSLKRWHVTVEAISPGAFGVALHDPAMLYHRRILLPASLHLAVLLGAKVVHVSSPLKPAGASFMPDDVLELLAEASELAANLGLTLALDNEAGHWADTGVAAAKIVREIGHMGIKLAYNPMEAIKAGEATFPAGYQAVMDQLLALFVGDCQGSDTGYAPVLPGDGHVHLRELVTALAAGNFKGPLVLAPNLVPRVEGARAAYESADRMLQLALREARKAAPSR